MAFITTVPVSSSARLSLSRCTARPARSSFAGSRMSPRVASPRAVTTPRMEFEISEGQKYDLNPIVIVLAFFGWVIPSSLPSNIPLTEGTGLTQAFFSAMNSNLANWPKGPAMDDPFWLLMVLWHIGLFACLIFGTIGYNLNKNNVQ